MKHIKFYNEFDTDQSCIDQYAAKIKEISQKLKRHAYRMDGFVDYPLRIKKDLLEDIKNTAQHIIKESNVLVVIGIGGSYLGAKALIEMLGGVKDGGISVLFAGCNLSAKYHMDILNKIAGKDFSVLVVSKSGSTAETSFAFALFKQELKKRYKNKYVNRIYAVTDKTVGNLRKECEQNGYKTFDLDEDIGGRYSVLTPVGLIPAAVSGYDIDAVINGAYAAFKEYENDDVNNNDCLRYALLRRLINDKYKKEIEAFIFFEPSMLSFGEWLKQLFAESEGKDGFGIFPASLLFSTDLHSMGQYLQDGRENFFQTFIYTKFDGPDIKLEDTALSINEYNKIVYKSALSAHKSRGTPILRIETDALDEEVFGYIVYFFEKACAVSCLIAQINPFDQPGVEIYKAEMKKIMQSNMPQN